MKLLTLIALVASIPLHDGPLAAQIAGDTIRYRTRSPEWSYGSFVALDDVALSLVSDDTTQDIPIGSIVQFEVGEKKNKAINLLGAVAGGALIGYLAHAQAVDSACNDPNRRCTTEPGGLSSGDAVLFGSSFAFVLSFIVVTVNPYSWKTVVVHR